MIYKKRKIGKWQSWQSTKSLLLDKKWYSTRFFWQVLHIILVIAYGGTVWADSEMSSLLTTLSIEELMELEVTTVAKRPQKLSDAAAAIFVITQDAIRRSGATSIAELLRMVPGVHVARLNANSWAISIRGFNNQFANKLLVLMDGRTLYSPLFSGVLWHLQDTPLEDIERIEVIRGPGASLWGVNAVNGVINIITKKARDTQGTLISTGVGTEDKAFGTIRYGGNVSEKGDYRVYLKAKEIDEFSDTMGNDMPDDWRMVQGGFRLDWHLNSQDDLTFQGDLYDLTRGEHETFYSLTPPYQFPYNFDIKASGINLLTRLSREHLSGDKWILQAYYDMSDAKSFVIDWDVDIFDLDFQHNFSSGSRQKWTWGLGYRFYRIKTNGKQHYFFDPASREINILSAFLQDEISLVTNRLFLTLGSKFEYNDNNTDFDIQPSGRLLWKINAQNTIWASASRAIRTASKGGLDSVFQTIQPQKNKPPIFLQIFGNHDLESEKLIALEIGFRTRLTNSLNLDLTGFINRYDNLVGVPAPTEPSSLQLNPVPHILATTKFENYMDGEVYGLETDVNWEVTQNWRLRAAYTFTKMFLHGEIDQNSFIGENMEGNTPQHIFSLRSQADISKNVEIDAWLRYVDSLPSFGISSYLTADVRIAWRPRSDLEVSLVGQNLFDSQYSEFLKFSVQGQGATEVERSIYGKLTWQF